VLVLPDAVARIRAEETSHEAIASARPAVRMAPRDVRILVDFEANVLRRGYFKRRAAALVLVALVVLARPWWFDVGDMRAPAPAKAATTAHR
jgi:hypothetical protein